MSLKITVFAFAMLSVAHAQADIMGTNIWIGASSGGSWKEPSNWRSMSVDGSVNPDASTTFNKNSNYVYDFSVLAKGATVTEDCTDTICIAGLVFGSDRETVTLERGTKNFYFSKETKIEVGVGTTIDFRLMHTDKWGGDAGTVVDFTGGGVFSYNVNDLGLSGAKFRMSESTTLRCPQSPSSYSTGFYMTVLEFLDSDSVLDLRADDIRFGSIVSADGVSPKVMLNGYSMAMVFAMMATMEVRRFGGYFDGPGSVCLQGGHTLMFTNANAFRNGATLQVKTVKLSGAVDGTTTLRMDDNGHFVIGADASVMRLVGEGTMGKVEVTSGNTLTVGGSGTTGADTYSAKLVGDGNLVKDGANYTLALTGENALAGGTKVKAGTLALQKSICNPVSEGLVAHWTFDDPADLGRDASGRGASLTGTNVSASEGVIGGAVHLTKGTAGDGSKLETIRLDKAGLPTGGKAVSLAYWVRVTEWSANDAQLCLYGHWAGGGVMYLMRAYSQTGNLELGSGGAISTLLVQNVFQTGQWVHIVATYDGNHNRALYVNGEKKVTGTDAEGTSMDIPVWDKFSIGVSETRDFTGDFDDYRIYNRALTEEEAKILYEAGTGAYAVPEAADVVVPQPVAKYTFDDATNPGADTSGNGYDLTADGSVTHVASRFGACGGCVKLDGNGFLKMNTEPKLVPISGSFSVSVRIQPGGASSPSYVFWGKDSKTPGSFFRAGANNSSLQEQVGSFSTDCDLMVNDFFTTYGGYSNDVGNEETWLHMVYTYDLNTKTMTAYRDGHFVKSQIIDTAFKATHDCFYIGYWPCEQNVKARGYFDDVRIYDCALTAEQVRALVRSVPTGSVPPILATGTSVAVDAGATLAAAGAGNAVSHLTGAGAVAIGALGSLKLTDAADFTGPVTGSGSLYLGGAFSGSVSGFVGTLGLANAFDVTTDNTGKNLPVVSRTGGIVTLPASGTLSFDCDPKSLTTRKFVLAEASDFVEPVNYDGWKLSPADGFYRAQFFVEDAGAGRKRFVAAMKYTRGLILIIE